MTEIEIDVKAKIFDDAEYCRKSRVNDHCIYMDARHGPYECRLFGMPLSLQNEDVLPEKCDQCKEAYQKAKQTCECEPFQSCEECQKDNRQATPEEIELNNNIIGNGGYSREW